jgi:hypothetical protein
MTVDVILGIIGPQELVILLIIFLVIFAVVKSINRKEKTPTPSRFEDLYNFDFPALLEKSIYKGEYVNPYVETDITFEYECTLNPSFLNAFDTLKMRLRSKGIEIETDRHIYLVLMSKRKTLTSEQIAYVVDSVCEAWKEDPYANPNGPSVSLFKAGKTYRESFDQNESTIIMRNDVKGGLTVEFQMIYEEMKRLGQKLKQ